MNILVKLLNFIEFCLDLLMMIRCIFCHEGCVRQVLFFDSYWFCFSFHSWSKLHSSIVFSLFFSLNLTFLLFLNFSSLHLPLLVDWWFFVVHNWLVETVWSCGFGLGVEIWRTWLSHIFATQSIISFSSVQLLWFFSFRSFYFIILILNFLFQCFVFTIS